jgi:autotransporter translocation and assembly factor TamB
MTDIIPEPGSAQFKKEKTDSLLKNIELQVSVKLVEDIVVDMNLGYFELDGDITITGDLQDPSYIGKVSIANGHVIYLDRQFELTEGSFINYSPEKLNPTLNLKAETEVFVATRGDTVSKDVPESYIIYMELSGDLDNPVLKFSEKEGKLNDADIISILTFGQRLGSIGSDLGERLKAFAGQSILGFGTRKLEQALRMDRIDIQGDIFKLGNNKEDVKNKPTLTLSKRINPRLLLTYETALGDLTRRKISALFRLTKKIFIKGNADNEDYGVDIIFKYSK